MRVEVVPDVVVARAVIASQISGQRRKNPSGGKRQESAVRDGIHATAEVVVKRALQTVGEALRGRELKAVVMTVCAGGELRHRRKSGISRLQIRKWSKTALSTRFDNRSLASDTAGLPHEFRRTAHAHWPCFQTDVRSRDSTP